MKIIILPLRNTCVLILIGFICFVSCSFDKNKINNHSSTLIKSFIEFRYGSPGDNTILRCYLKGIYFKDDSVIIVSIRDDYNYEYSKTRLSDDSVRLFDAYLNQIQIDSVRGSELIKQSRDDHVPYCGDDYGLVKLNDSLGVFNSVYFTRQRRNGLDSLRNFVFSLKGNLTTDTIELVNSIHRIQKEYITVFPPIPTVQTVKFKPPVIIDGPPKE